jgi:putative membrane protein
MIQGYSDHAANERTYLAWVRTGIAVIAFGFVVEKFNIFMATIVQAAGHEVGRELPFSPMGSFGRWDGLALILSGVALLIVATVRFVRTTALLDDPAIHSAKSVRLEVMVSTILIVVIASYSVYLAIGGGGPRG